MTERGRKILEGRRERILKGLKETKAGETICLTDWQAKIIVDWIEEKTGKMETGVAR